jgi:hypothetical protein
MTPQEAWDKIKKALTPNSNGDLDTIEWVFRNDCKVIETIIPKDAKPDVHPKQISLEDLGF